MKKVMITGASGQLGLALYRLLQDNSAYELLRTNAFANEDSTIQALDITEELAVREYIQVHKPDIIINCAAMTAVDLCETEQEGSLPHQCSGTKISCAGSRANRSKTSSCLNGLRVRRTGEGTVY